MKKNSKQRLFEMMGRLDSSFKKKLNENVNDENSQEIEEIIYELGISIEDIRSLFDYEEFVNGKYIGNDTHMGIWDFMGNMTDWGNDLFHEIYDGGSQWISEEEVIDILYQISQKSGLGENVSENTLNERNQYHRTPIEDFMRKYPVGTKLKVTRSVPHIGNISAIEIADFEPDRENAVMVYKYNKHDGSLYNQQPDQMSHDVILNVIKSGVLVPDDMNEVTDGYDNDNGDEDFNISTGGINQYILNLEKNHGPLDFYETLVEVIDYSRSHSVSSESIAKATIINLIEKAKNFNINDYY